MKKLSKLIKTFTIPAEKIEEYRSNPDIGKPTKEQILDHIASLAMNTDNVYDWVLTKNTWEERDEEAIAKLDRELAAVEAQKAGYLDLLEKSKNVYRDACAARRAKWWYPFYKAFAHLPDWPTTSMVREVTDARDKVDFANLLISEFGKRPTTKITIEYYLKVYIK